MIRDLPLVASNFRNTQALDEYLVERNVVGIADIDTRRLTRILREKGSLNGCVMAGDDINEARALELAKGFAGLKGMDFNDFVIKMHDTPRFGNTNGLSSRIL